MPYVHVRITREGDVSAAKKAAIIAGMTRVLEEVLAKDPRTTFVVIDEVELDSWGVGGLPVEQYRQRQASRSRHPAPEPRLAAPAPPFPGPAPPFEGPSIPPDDDSTARNTPR